VPLIGNIKYMKDFITRKQRLNKESKPLNFIQALVGFIATVIITLLIIDLIGFTLWALSGQTPQDSFFIGAITSLVI
jgi:hypothetical protein